MKMTELEQIIQYIDNRIIKLEQEAMDTQRHRQVNEIKKEFTELLNFMDKIGNVETTSHNELSKP